MPKGTKRKLSEQQEPYQAYNWAWTMLNYTAEETAFIVGLSLLEEKPYTGLQFIKEICPTTGTPHLQGMVVFGKKMTRGAVQKALSPARPQQLSTKPCYASVASNEAYTSKEGGTDFHKDGSFAEAEDPTKLDANGRAEQLLKLAEAADWKTLRSEHQAAWLYQRRQLISARGACLTCSDVLDGVLENYWVYGEAGGGKDQYALSLATDPFTKPGNTKWWCEYDGQADVVLRDVGHSVMAIMDEFKVWTDRYKFFGEWKGGGFNIRPLRLFVTSNYHPRDIKGLDSLSLAALERRFQFIKIVDGKAKWAPRVNIERPALAIREEWDGVE